MLLLPSCSIVEEFIEKTKEMLRKYLSPKENKLFMCGKFAVLSYSEEIPPERRYELAFLEGIKNKSFKAELGPYRGTIKIEKIGKSERVACTVIMRFAEKVKMSRGMELSTGKIEKISLFGSITHIIQYRFDVYAGIMIFLYGMNYDLLPLSKYRPVDNRRKGLYLYLFSRYERELGFMYVMRENIDKIVSLVIDIILGRYPKTKIRI